MEHGRLAGRVAVVTGGVRGLGAATVRRFVEEGARVAVWDPSAQVGQERFADIADAVLLVDVDVSDSRSVDAAEARTREAIGPIQILVNNAGIAEPRDPADVDDDSWNRIMQINANGTFWCIRAVLPGMREAHYGKIVNISSIAALNARKSTHPAYAASKAAVLGMVSSLVRSVGNSGICVNAVLPGFIRTEIHESYTIEQLAEIALDIPLDRAGTPEDVANACLYLASSESDYVTGLYLNVNGGSAVG